MINDIKKHAAECYPQESCGVVVLVDGVETYMPCRNVADTPTESFRIDAVDLMRIEDQYGAPVAVVHSHPDATARPSDGDRKMCEAHGIPYHIISIGKLMPEGFDFSEVFTVVPCGWKAPLEGRQFAHGTLDCYSLVQDWYAEKLGVQLPDFHRQDDWWNKGERLYTKEVFFEHGFREVGVDAMEVGDVLIMQVMAPVENHAAIYVGNGKILHHMFGQTSRIVPFGGFLKSTTRYVMRYSK